MTTFQIISGGIISPFCDAFFFAVDRHFPQDVLPTDTGLIVADAFGAEIIKFGPSLEVPAARRKAVITKFAMNAGERLHHQRENLRQKDRFPFLRKS